MTGSARTTRMLILLAACCASANADDIEEQLGWVERGAPRVILAADLAAGRVHFLGVCGYSCKVVPDIGWLNHDLCYSRSASVRIIEGTTDAPSSPRHEVLNQRAFDFAAEFNRLMRDALDEQGLRDCPPGEDWDGLLNSVATYAEELEPEHSLALSFGKDPTLRTFTPRLTLRGLEQLTGDVRSRLCELVGRAGIRRRVSFEVTLRSGEPTATIACVEGALEK